jgi:hypothetical protein
MLTQWWRPVFTPPIKLHKNSLSGRIKPMSSVPLPVAFDLCIFGAVPPLDNTIAEVGSSITARAWLAGPV